MIKIDDFATSLRALVRWFRCGRHGLRNRRTLIASPVSEPARAGPANVTRRGPLAEPHARFGPQHIGHLPDTAGLAARMTLEDSCQQIRTSQSNPALMVDGPHNVMVRAARHHYTRRRRRPKPRREP